MLETVLGAVIAIVITIAVENWRRPKLRLEIAPFGEPTYGPGKPATSSRYLALRLHNDSLPRFVGWMSRSAAFRCNGQITFHHLIDGQDFFGKSMPIRWGATEQPIPQQLVDTAGRLIGHIVDEDRLMRTPTVDIYPGEHADLDVAVRFDSDNDCFGWSNLNYHSNPPWRHPGWKLPPGRYLVKVTLRSAGEKCNGLFRLVNDGPRDSFRLLPTDAGDKVQ